MATKTIAWATGTGSITISYGGSGSGTATITTSDNNLYEARSQEITLRTTAGSPQVTKKVTITQAARVRTDISAAVVTAANQTYNGSALTPTPTVVLNGATIPSSGYNVTYSNNTNAGSATITITGKGDYTGTATGTFTIAKASRTISFTTAPTSVEVGETITVVAAPSAGSGDGTITYSSSNTSKASVSGNVVTGVALGSCTISATISGGSNYNDATTSYSLGVTEKNYANEYFTIESLEDGNEISLARYNSISRVVYWSTDKTSWTQNNSASVKVTLGKGQRLYVKRTGTSMADSSTKYCYFCASKDFVVSGNIMSLINGDDFVGTDLTDSNSYAFVRLFNANATLVSAEHLILPNSTSLCCYYYMFRGCTSLLVAPKMPATILSHSCYLGTYYGCSSLPTASQLPAATLVANCYQYMFYNCHNLSYIQCLATDISASNCTDSWVGGIASYGTFVKPSSMTSWETGADGIPSGWTAKTPISSHVEIEYIQSTGTQYINLGIYATEKYGVSLKYQYSSLVSTSGAGRVFGTKTGSNATGAFGYVNTSTGNTSASSKFYLGSNGGLSNSIDIDANVHVVKMNVDNDKKVYFDDTLVVTGNSDAFTNSAEASLFRCNSGGTWYAGGRAKAFILQVYYNGVLVMNLISIRVSTTGYLYDKISGRYFSNNGTSSFTLGADIVG